MTLIVIVIAKISSFSCSLSVVLLSPYHEAERIGNTYDCALVCSYVYFSSFSE